MAPLCILLIVSLFALERASGHDAPVWDVLLPDQAYVLRDGPASYKLYYAGEDFASINLATSPDGLAWTAYAGNPIITDGQYHATVHYYETAFAGANVGTDPSTSTGMHYRMWYAGPTNYGIGNWRYAESEDGIVWRNRVAVTQVGGAPLVWSSATGVAYGIADAVEVNGQFRIYANVQWELGEFSAQELTVVAFSENGYEWSGHDPASVGFATPVFGPSHAWGDFDLAHVGWFKVERHAADDWEAFYSGGDETTYSPKNGIGRATSTDGFVWTRTGAIATTDDSVDWRNMSCWMPSAVAMNGTHYRIYFLGSSADQSDGSWIWWKLGYVDYERPQPPPPPAEATVKARIELEIPASALIAAIAALKVNVTTTC